jgi:hypothetical protein
MRTGLSAKGIIGLCRITILIATVKLRPYAMWDGRTSATPRFSQRSAPATFAPHRYICASSTASSSEICSAENPDIKNSLPYSKLCESLTLIFEDNGKGFPEEIDFRNPDTLGLQLVNTLVEQIEGSIDLERGRGTKFIIKFRRELQFQENG